MAALSRLVWRKNPRITIAPLRLVLTKNLSLSRDAPSGEKAGTVKKICHCEPVRAAKQVPLGYTLAWQSAPEPFVLHF